MSGDILKLISDNEQDRAAAERWWQEASPVDKMEVFACISRSYDEPAMEIMSRFAQLAFTEMAEKFAKEGSGNG